jgi:hypothetical protein
MRAMEDTGTFVECFDAATNSCVVTPACGLRHALAGALEAFARHLDQFTIADLVPDSKATGGSSMRKRPLLRRNGEPAILTSSFSEARNICNELLRHLAQMFKAKNKLLLMNLSV